MLLTTKLISLMRFMGPIFVVLCILVVIFITSIYFYYIMPAFYLLYGSPYTELLTVIGIWFVINIEYNHIACIVYGQHNKIKLFESNYLLIKSNYCKECESYMPLQAHHCNICGYCILKMDHHCPWISTCVGFYNYQHFLLFLFYLNMGSIYFILMTMISINDYGINTLILVSLIMSVAVMLSTSAFLLFHIILISRNMTSIGLFLKPFHNETDDYGKSNWTNKSTFISNLQEIFGKEHFICWFLPKHRRLNDSIEVNATNG